MPALPYILALAAAIALWMRSRRDDSGGSSVIVQGYRKGIPFDLAVEKVDNVWMAKRAAERFLSMKADAARAGVPLRVNSGFRSMMEQERFFNMTAEERKAYGIGTLVARPGFSNHQSGDALDISTTNDPRVLPWLRANAAQYGFVNTVPSEPWHWELTHVA